MAYIAAGRATAPAGLAGGEGGEVVVVDVALALLNAEAVEDLLVVAGAEGGYGEDLGLAAGEETGAVGAGEDADLDVDGADVGGAAAVGALAALEDGVADLFFEEGLERLADGGLDQRLLIVRGELGEVGDGLVP